MYRSQSIVLLFQISISWLIWHSKFEPCVYNQRDMSERVQTAEQLIENFSPEELSQFASWFANYQDALWERQIEQDSLSGKLDHLIEKAHRDFEAGRVKEI